ncbi:MAG: four helix bundle protein [Candidatus Liptonbacteria bacterium]|nr:four helix bundle protein [Candidatus Liptonbacteria bacterium]
MPIIQRLVRAYELWHGFLPHIPKDVRYTLGAKIDASLVDTIESVLTASFLPRDRKLPLLECAAAKLDLTKFFLQIAWEMRALDNKKYAMLSEELSEVGRMLGGWLRQFTSRS